ncbi:LOW QUALITY PROTEIN: hypothetical protein ACHAXA_008520 [Cyclostephanos tholiformis]|uniref:Uncharacterized protein n=1 Tax=Cyclostephanos tholiformis TaxID=382380 RepID=A0ABD3RR91_9STRA
MMKGQKQLRSRSIPTTKIIVIIFTVAIFSIYFFHDSGMIARMTIAASTSVVRWGGWTETSITDWTKPFCLSWFASDANNLYSLSIYGTHHPNWIVTSENGDEFCVELADKSPIIGNMMHFYANQFLSSCKLVHARYQWGSGWSADFWNINCGLIHALFYRVPCLITAWEPHNPNIGLERTHPWNYAANKKDYGRPNQTSLVCEAGDTTCYFLPYHGCGPIDKLKNDSSVKLLLEVEEKGVDGYDRDNDIGWAAYLFATRKQLWIRRAVFDYKELFKQKFNWYKKSDCTVMHVRRGDVIYDTRHYYPVAFYVDMIPEEKLNDPNHYVFLLTDDFNAIEEAHEFFPNIKWAYFNRTRHRGNSSGWEDHTPSGDPALEVVVILSAFDLVQDCSTLVQGPSGFAEIIYQFMLRSGRFNITLYDVSSNPSTARMNSVPLNESAPLLEKILEELRLNMTVAQQSSGTKKN